MRVQLRLVVGCAPDRAWALLRSPAGVASVYAPALRLDPVAPIPERWGQGDAVEVRLLVAGVVPAGRQRIAIRMRRRGDTRIFEDVGGPISGPLAVVTSWRHRMAVTPLPDGTTLFRDRLDIQAGQLTPAVWIVLWATWQWRAARLRRVLAQ